MENDFQYKRAAAKVKKINEINPEKDIRVRILGRIIDRNDDVLVVDDGSQKTEIIIDPALEVSQDSLVRIIARVLPLESGFDLRAEAVQDMTGLDVELYNKIMK